MRTSSLFAIITLAAVKVAAWGTVGHETVAYVAQGFLDATAKAWVQDLLGKQSMASVSTWPDQYRHGADGAWSASLHYIDAQDQPPQTCGVSFDRDCGEKGCIVGAIANYTSRVVDPKVGKAEQQMALKFLIHFFGDIVQPLHCEALDVGGNEIKVKFHSKQTNLHAVWDTNMVEQIAGGTDSEKFSKVLINAINNGEYKKVTSDWIKCIDTEQAQKCSAQWASDSNSFICSTALKGGADSLEGKDLSSGAYYNAAVPVIKQQLAKGGYRLGNYLNKLAAKHQKLDLEEW